MGEEREPGYREELDDTTISERIFQVLLYPPLFLNPLLQEESPLLDHKEHDIEGFQDLQVFRYPIVKDLLLTPSQGSQDPPVFLDPYSLDLDVILEDIYLDLQILFFHPVI